MGTSALLLYTRSIRVGVAPARILSLVSQATLTLFLTHWLLLQLFDRTGLRQFSSGFHLRDVLLAWGMAMAVGVGLWLLLTSILRAWQHTRRAMGDAGEAEGLSNAAGSLRPTSTV